ncbi:SRP40, C-terminal domain-containing protein [Suillus spraguei]|nr:SRP40, C-terminal domain-containing protein [Suillus spraguei]
MSDTNLAVTYSLIYVFLKQQSQTKAADAVKKAARNIIVLKDDLQLEGSPLDEIVKQWKESRANNSSSDSDSSDDSSDDSSTSSSSDSSSSSSDSTSEDEAGNESESNSKKGIQSRKKVPETLPCGDRETSATLSSDAKVPDVKSIITKKKSPVKGSSSSSSGSDSDSDSDNLATDSAPNKKLAHKDTPKSDGNSSDSDSSSSSPDSSSSSSDSSSSDSESTSASSESTTSSSESESEAEITPISGKIPVKRDVVSSKSKTNTSVASIPKEEMQVLKKRKTSESGAAVVTAVVSIDDVQVSMKNRNTKKNGNSKPPRNVNERFSRIKPQIIPPEQLLDNGYEAKGGITNDYGSRAHQDLIVTRGAGFRKEKNKKKRGSYRGGEITLQSHSIKFTD